ncbi:MAG: nuclear transport factor 2 family protein, partial [Pseudomonadota bacterium]
MSDKPTAHKALIAPLRAAMVDFEEDPVRGALAALLVPDAPVRLSEPIGEMAGPDDFYRKAYAPLLDAWPDLERRDTIVIAGTDEFGIEWVGCGGCYVGTFEGPWLSIPPTGRLVSMRFHEFFRMENGRVTEIQALWDIPEVMMQADAWPLAPSLGREWQVPGPMTQDGIVPGPYDEEKSRKSREVIVEMLTHMKRHPASPPEAMEMPRFWHPRMSWYGPAGIGTARGIKGFRHIHQIPFLNGMP